MDAAVKMSKRKLKVVDCEGLNELLYQMHQEERPQIRICMPRHNAAELAINDTCRTSPLLVQLASNLHIILDHLIHCLL